jgi:hypothetical protein
MGHDVAVSTLEDILDQLHFSATDERDKGDKFERLMLQFFKTDLQWSERFADVWLWMDWPHRAGRRGAGRAGRVSAVPGAVDLHVVSVAAGVVPGG